ncbi:hypothetical protein [Bacillus sp. FJAT-52991]|uniref:DNA helicase n=1 Tax=Bacillus kandeliae TaxID=3129297 RepID=A0ABZ2N875_9BACI
MAIESDLSIDNELDRLLELYDGVTEISLDKDMVLKELETLKQISKSTPQSIGKNKLGRILFGTIHSVKGETHKATLVVNWKFERGFNESKKEYDVFEMVEKQLLGVPYNDSLNINEEEKTVLESVLRLIYVAFSRPTHLLVFALPKSQFDEDLNRRMNFEQAGWVIHG